jgi:hypothetical protein
VRADVAGIAALCDGAVGVRSAVRVDLLWAIVFVVVFALLALHAGPNLGPNTDAVANFDRAHFRADFDGLADNLMTYAEGKRDLAPTASDAVDIGAANTAALDLDVDVVVFEGLRLELLVVRS